MNGHPAETQGRLEVKGRPLWRPRRLWRSWSPEERWRRPSRPAILATATAAGLTKVLLYFLVNRILYVLYISKRK